MVKKWEKSLQGGAEILNVSRNRDKNSPVLITGELHLLQPVPVSLTTIMSGQSGGFEG